jgi:hypothetical protein
LPTGGSISTLLTVRSIALDLKARARLRPSQVTSPRFVAQ